MSTDRPDNEDITATLRVALDAGRLDHQDSIVFHDLGLMQRRLRGLWRHLPDPVNHCLAVKANPVVGVLRSAVECGAGLECASLEEVGLALAAGCAPHKIVCDSPAKTVRDLEFLLERGIHLNADNFEELDRIGSLLGSDAPKGPIGVRVNPLVGSGAIAATSVGDATSKFGIHLDEHEEQVRRAFARWPWLTGLHVHVGSQGVTLDQLRRSVRAAVDLADAIDAEAGDARVTHLDVGGGLPTRYRSTDAPPSLEAYSEAIAEELERGDHRRIAVTELGRAVQAHCGFAVTRVEYVKRLESVRYAVVHLGADFLMRPVYRPEDWHHEVFLTDASGNARTGPTSSWSIAGPLCFGGDVIARERELPEPRPGDLLVIRDVGAYTLGLWSRHCSRGLPEVVGIEGGELNTLLPRETPEDVVGFWEGTARA
ncbi:MAG: diaminopimelate decarboxylase [Acidobacteriota bacterium]